MVRFGSTMLTVVVADFVGSATEVAVIVASPPLTEVTTPLAPTVATYALLVAKVTDVLEDPVTVAVRVCLISGVANSYVDSLNVTETIALPASADVPPFELAPPLVALPPALVVPPTGVLAPGLVPPVAVSAPAVAVSAPPVELSPPVTLDPPPTLPTPPAPELGLEL